MTTTAAGQQLDTILKQLFHIFHYTCQSTLPVSLTSSCSFGNGTQHNCHVLLLFCELFVFSLHSSCLYTGFNVTNEGTLQKLSHIRVVSVWFSTTLRLSPAWITSQTEISTHLTCLSSFSSSLSSSTLRASGLLIIYITTHIILASVISINVTISLIDNE